jgi:hypothetical protein
VNVILPYYSNILCRGTLRRLELKICVVNCKTFIQTQTRFKIRVPIEGFLPYIFFRTHNTSCLSFGLFPCGSNLVLSLMFGSLVEGGSVGRWPYTRLGVLSPCICTSSLISCGQNVRQQSPFWMHRLMGHSRVMSGNSEESLKQFYITLNISSVLTDTNSTSDLLDYHAPYGCCIHTQWWPLFCLYSPLTNTHSLFIGVVCGDHC